MKIGNITEINLLSQLDDKGIYGYAAKARLAWNQKGQKVTITNLRTNRDTVIGAESCADALRQYLANNAF
jgi:hypothetical protein